MNPGRIPRGRGGSGVYEARMSESERQINPFFYTKEILVELEISLRPGA